MEVNLSHLHQRHRFAAVMTKLHLHKVIKALSYPSSPTSNVRLPTDDPLNSHKGLQESSPPIKSRPAVHSNVQTMRNYALQRSTKIPLRVPAAFPTNLNFSQQTFCLFEALSDDEEEGDLSCFLDDLFNGPPSSPDHTNDTSAHDHTRTIRDYKQSLSGKLSTIHTHLKARRGSSTSPVLPTLSVVSLPEKSPSQKAFIYTKFWKKI